MLPTPAIAVWSSSRALSDVLRLRRRRQRGRAGGAEPDQDVLAATPHRLDAMVDDRVDELFGLGMPDDRREAELAARDRAADQLRPQVRGYRLDLRQLRHGLPPAFSC